MNAEMQNEVFLGENVGNYASYPKPLTTDEYYLEKMYRLIKENGGGGGGDNDFVVNYLIETGMESGESTIVCDKTAAEIYEAWETGKNVKASFPELVPFQIPIVMASQEDGYTLIEFGLIGCEERVYFMGVMHSEDSDVINIVPLQNTLVDTVLLNNELGDLEERFASNSIVYRQIDANGDIEVEDEEAILSLLQGISKNVRCVFDPNAVSEPHLVLNIQSVNTVYNSSDQTKTHTVIFSNVLPTATGVKYVFITQSATTNSTTTELISHTETYEEKVLAVQAP